MIRCSFAFVLTLFLALLPWSAAAHAQPQDYLTLKRRIWDRWEQVMNQYPAGPQRQAAFEQYVNQPLARLDPDRINDFRNVCQDAGVSYDEKLFSAGSPPWSKSFKKGGDLDTQAPDLRAYYRMRRAAKARGLQVTDNGNSFSIGSHETTVHMPPSRFNGPTSQAAYERAMAADQEAAEYIAQGGSTTIPTAKGPVTLRRNVLRTPMAEAGDYLKKAHEARDFLEGPNVGRQQVIESMNFSNKAVYKTEQSLRKAGINPGMAIHRKTSAELDTMLGNRKGAEAVAFARKQNENAFRQLDRMLVKSAKATARDIADLRGRIIAAEKAGDTAKAVALRQQLVNTRNLINRTASQTGRREIVRKVFQEGDDAANAGSKGARYLKKLSEKFGKMSPALKKLGGILLKGFSAAARAAELHALYKEYEAAEQREAEWAQKIGRDPSTGGIAKEFVFGALGFHRAKEAADQAMARQGKDANPSDWEYIRTFVAVYADQNIEAVGPLGNDPTVKLEEYMRAHPEFARKYGVVLEDDAMADATPPTPPETAKTKPDAPNPPAAPTPPPMVAASLPPDKGADAKEKKDNAPDPPPMVRASLENKDDNEKKPDKKSTGQEPDAKTSDPGSGKPSQARTTGPKTRSGPTQPAGFKANRPYTVTGMALETEQRKCRVGAKTYKTFEGIVDGSGMSVTVNQDGRSYILSGESARLVLEKQRFIERLAYCGYVTTGRYAGFGPGITQAAPAKPQPKINWNVWKTRNNPSKKYKCINSLCKDCSMWTHIGAPLYDKCRNCLEQNRQKLLSCGGP